MNRALLIALLASVLAAGFVVLWIQTRSADYSHGRRLSETELEKAMARFAYWRGRHDAAESVEPLVGSEAQREIRLSLRDSEMSELLPDINNSHRGDSDQRWRSISEKIKTSHVLLNEYTNGFRQQLQLMEARFEIPAWVEFVPAGNEFRVQMPRYPKIFTNVGPQLISVTYGTQLDPWRSFAVHQFSSANPGDRVVRKDIEDALLRQHGAQGRKLIADELGSHHILGSFRSILAEHSGFGHTVNQTVVENADKVYVIEVGQPNYSVRNS